jgi:tartronate-semialdehyde synthase
MDYQVQLSFENIDAPELGAYGPGPRRRRRSWLQGPFGLPIQTEHAAFATAREWIARYSVSVIVEFIVERVTNIAMGTEIDNIIEFEGGP